MQNECAMRCHGELLFTIRPRLILLCLVFTSAGSTRKIIDRNEFRPDTNTSNEK